MRNFEELNPNIQQNTVVSKRWRRFSKGYFHRVARTVRYTCSLSGKRSKRPVVKIAAINHEKKQCNAYYDAMMWYMEEITGYNYY